MKVRFHSEAEEEFTEAVFWYNVQRKGLGDEFFLCIDEAIERIKRNPQMQPYVHNQIRRAVVRRYPFAIFYETTELEIRILAVFHSRRDPIQWRKRN
jgi:toxin ParE1/3/4